MLALCALTISMTIANPSPAPKFSRFFGCSPDRLGIEEVRAHQLHLAGLGWSWSHINQVSCALRFFYVFLEMVIDPVSSVVFEAEPTEGRAMQRPPRNPNSPLVSRWLVVASLLQGGIVLLIVATIYAVALDRNMPETEARALAFVTLVTTNFAMILINRATGFAIVDLVRRPNVVLWGVVAITTIILLIVVLTPSLRTVFFFGPLHGDDLILCALAGLAAFAALELVKWVMSTLGYRG
jgi:Ca2+-transporting ATPase